MYLQGISSGQQHPSVIMADAALQQWESEYHAPARQLATVLHRLHGNQLESLVVAVWGVNLTFDSQCLMESSVNSLIHTLVNAGMRVNLHDPLYKPRPATTHYPLGQVRIMENRNATLTGADMLVLWNPCVSFADIDIGLVHQHMNAPVIIDMCNMLDQGVMLSHNIQYFSPVTMSQ